MTASDSFPRPPSGAIATGWGVHGLPGLATVLEAPVGWPWSFPKGQPGRIVLAWGHRPTSCRAEAYAQQHNLPLWRLEDGFLRSLGLGKMDSTYEVFRRAIGYSTSDAPLSLVVDDLGIHYDATTPSRLEALIQLPLTEPEINRARKLACDWREGRVSKYNHARDYTGKLPARYVLAVDQTKGDPSIRFGRGDALSFQRMLAAALEENPECTVVLKVHPQVFAGRRQGHFDLAAVAKQPRVLVLGEDAHPASLLENAEAVYAVTSQMGFEGLLWGKPVRMFGMPFYAGWGLTRDELPAPARRRPMPVENLVHAALAVYSRYLDPETGERCEVERVLEWISLQRRMRERFPATVYATGFSRWKIPIVRDYLAGSRVEFVVQIEQVPALGTVAIWGRKPVPGTWPQGVKSIRLEDGFLRSVGLGADLVRPLSWVADTRGIYYDATEPSDLEHLLQTAEFSVELCQGAATLREKIVASGLTKYNVGSAIWIRPAGKSCVILVPGQVESDASIRLGAPGLRTNLALLRAVREANPEAYLVYKPHPDVLAGLRARAADEAETHRWCDEMVTEVKMDDLLGQVDEVHVLTSLAGFEALLRHKRVICYGRPFYSGWGLTTDIVPLARRTRRLSLDELVAATLILYPAYLNPATHRFTTPERTLENLLAWRCKGPSTLPVWRRVLRWFLRLRAD